METILSIGEFLDSINMLLGDVPAMVRGEVTGWKIHPTGIYFSLKDKEDGSVMECYMSPHTFRGLGIVVEDGMEVKAVGTAGIYKPRGRFSFRTEHLEPMGEGALKQAYEALKRQLEHEGLFARKRPLPEFISRIGVITSRTGAVIDDFRKNLDKLGLNLTLYDVRVEGAKAAGQVVRAIEWFNAHQKDFDILVVMRGGGSLEDLQAFNNEIVARAIFASAIPTVVAIGHDRDAPIASLIGDAATSTPTAAAMLVNETWNRVRMDVPRLNDGIVHRFESWISDFASRLDISSLVALYERHIESARERIESLDAYLHAVDPERNLLLGYSITTNARGAVVKSATALRVGDVVHTRLHRGRLTAHVKDITK